MQTSTTGSNSGQSEFEEMFDRVDSNGDRRIDFEEFSTLLRSLDPRRPADRLRAGFDAIDADRDGLVSYEEFRAWVGR